jgi:hypothetical protein
LKTFVTQIQPALPLTPDPPVICYWKCIRWKDYEVLKITIWRALLPKKRIVFSPGISLPTHRTRIGPTNYFLTNLSTRPCSRHVQSFLPEVRSVVSQASNAARRTASRLPYRCPRTFHRLIRVHRPPHQPHDSVRSPLQIHQSGG